MMQDLKKLFFHPYTAILFIAFFALRLLSYFIAENLFIQNILGLALVLTLIIVYIKKPSYACQLVIAELFLGGSGHFIEVFGLSIRTFFLITYISMYLGHIIFSKKKRQELLIPHILYIFFGAFGLALVWATVNGMLEHNETKLIIQDIIPFAFFALLLPLHQLIKDKSNYPFLIRLVAVFIFGSALFSLITFILFSTGSTVLQGSYYHWFRDIVSGKLTDVGNGFWRIVTPEHLLLLPITIILVSVIARNAVTWQSRSEKIILYLALLASLFTLTINFSRGYFLALIVALLPLLYKHSFKRWLSTSAITGAAILIIFCATSFIASGAKTFGLELFGFRIKSFTSPHIEESTYTRTALLKPILQKFESHPITGSGFGSTITFTNPISKTQITTPQFDWGYFEIITEFGLIGAVVYFFLIAYLIYLTILYIQTTTLHPDFLVGVLAGLVALLVSNLTAPALSHVFGVFYITMLLAIILHCDNMREKIKLGLAKLYRKFI